MKWIDAAVQAAALADEADPSGAPHHHAPNLSFMTDDGTRFGRWRVTRESMEDGSGWAVWDMRHGPEVRPHLVRVIGGLPTPRSAIAIAEACERSAVLRVGLALVRGLAWTAECVREEVSTTSRERRG